MLEKIYKITLAAALLCFAFYLLIKDRTLGGAGGILLLLTAVLRLCADAKTGNLPWQRDKKQ